MKLRHVHLYTLAAVCAVIAGARLFRASSEDEPRSGVSPARKLSLVPDSSHLQPTAADSLGTLTNLSVSSDRFMAVLDASNHRVTLIDSGGVVYGAVGRRGSGPGEFTMASEVALLQDHRVAVSDMRSRIVTWLANGQPGPVLTPTNGVIAGIASSRNSLFVKTWLPVTGEIQVLRYDSTLASAPVVLARVHPEGSGVSNGSNPYDSCAVCAFAVADNGEIAISSSPTQFRIEVITPKGKRRTLSRDYPVIPVDPEIRRKDEAMAAQSGRRLKIPEYEFMVRGMFYDSDGHLWVRRTIKSGDRVATVMERNRTDDGTLLDILDTTDVHLAAVRGTRAVVISRDSSSNLRSLAFYQLRAVSQ